MHQWLSATLVTDYPDLAELPPSGSAGCNRFEALLAAGLILPILDGLDEISESARAVAITRINKELKPGAQVVVTCRTQQYKAALSPERGRGVVLRAAAVELSALKFDEVVSYLRKDAGPAARDRWDCLNTLGAESPARQALATPLMAGLARAIYNPRADELVRDLHHPAELCDFADQSAVKAHLFDAFIPAAFRFPAGRRWSATQAETWLVFLARHLEQTIGTADLGWWQLQKALPRTTFRVIVGLTLGFALLTAAWFVIAVAIVWGLFRGLKIVLGRDKAPARGTQISVSRLAFLFGSAEAPARGMRIRLSGLMIGLAGSLVITLVYGLAGGLAQGSARGLTAGLLAGIVTGLLIGFGGVPEDLAEATNPGTVLARDRRTALLLILVVALGFGLVPGLLGVLSGGSPHGLVFELAALLLVILYSGLTTGLVTGLGLSMSQAAWLSYVLTRGWLVLRGCLPWALMDFLSDAHRRGVLRQTGAVYQFRHIELQRRLAHRDASVAAAKDK